MNTTRTLTIDVVSDLVSPWCYLGTRRLSRALGSLQGASEPEVRWQPFEINPAIPVQGMDVDRYLNSVFGSADAAREALDQVASEGVREGIQFNFDDVKSVPNTLAAHRLILLAEEQEQGGPMAQALFRGFFEEGLDIGDKDVLAELAGEVGLDSDVTSAYLAGDRNIDLVKTKEAEVRGAGLTGVPSIIINRRLAVLGVQDSDTILSAIEQALFHELPERVSPALLH